MQLSGGLLGFGARKARRLPPELLPLARTLYQLQRPCGPLLGPAFATPAALGLTYDQPGTIQAAGRGSSHATGVGAGAASGDGSSNATGAAGAANTSSAAGGGGGGGFPAASSAPMDERLLRMGALLAGGLRASLLMVQPRLYLWQGSQPQGGFGQGQQGQGAVLLELPASDLAALAAVQGQLLAPGTQGQAQGAPGQGQGAAFVVVHAGHSVLAAPVPGVGTAAAPAAQGQVAAGSVPGAADVEALQAQVLALGATAWPAPELLLLPCIDPPTSTSPQPPASQPSGQKAGKGSAQVAGSAWALVQAHLLPLAGSKVGEVQALHPDLLPMHAQGQGSGSAGVSSDPSFAEWCQAGGVQVTSQWL